MKKNNLEKMQIEWIKVGNLSLAEQHEKAKKANDIFVDIAVKYYVDKMKKEKGGNKNATEKNQ